jgi:hypothetical protein
MPNKEIRDAISYFLPFADVVSDACGHSLCLGIRGFGEKKRVLGMPYDG